MKSLADSPVHSSSEPEFSLYFDEAPNHGPLVRAAVVSVLIHLLGVVFLSSVEFHATPIRPGANLHIATRVTPLVVPPDVLRQLTQKAPQTREVSHEFNVENLIPRPEMKKSPPAQPAVSPKPRVGVPSPSPLPDAPQIAASAPASAMLPPPGFGVSNQPAPPPPPQIQVQEKPKLTFENVPGTGRSTGNVSGGVSSPKVNIPMPKANIDETMARVSKRPGGGTVVGDETEAYPSIGQSLGNKATPGKMGSSLELLSDPQGADFRPYLLRILNSVRINWFAVIPESARLGRRGKVVVQFAISKDGKVPKLIIASPSGADPLDRAAVAGISASNPFPPLPVEFKGSEIRLQLVFVYNGPR
ncbi:MAG: TonB family protein [Bryobacteraceae bacterium]